MAIKISGTTVINDSKETTNLKLLPRHTDIATTSVLSINTNQYDSYAVTSLSENITIATDSASPSAVTGQKLLLRFKDNGTARTINWASAAYGYRGVGSDLPLTTTPGKNLYVGLIFNSPDNIWDAIAVVEG